jgi:DNA-binding transcriptional regulator YiaG
MAHDLKRRPEQCDRCEGPLESRAIPRWVEPIIELPGVVLLDAVTVQACVTCEHWASPDVPDVEALATAAALARVRRSERLDAAAIRFLRRRLGLSRTELADALGMRPEHVARWEGAVAAMSEPAEKLLRVLVVQRLQESSPDAGPGRRSTPFEVATVVLHPPPRTARLTFRLDATRTRWVPDAADFLAPARRTLAPRPRQR